MKLNEHFGLVNLNEIHILRSPDIKMITKSVSKPNNYRTV